MTLRLYMANAAAPYTPTTKRGAWDKATQTLARYLAPSPQGAATTVNVTPGSTAANWDVLWGRWISDAAVSAGTLSGTLSWVIGVLEANAACNGFWHIHAFVTQGDTDNLRGTLLTDSIGATEFTTTATGRGEGAKAISSVSVQVGDRICIEVGYQSASDLTTRSMTMNYGNTGVTDVTQGSTSVTTRPGWFEFSTGDGIFYSPLSTVVDDFASGTLANPPWSTQYGSPTVVSGQLRLPATSLAGAPQYAGAQIDGGTGKYELDSFYAKLITIPSSTGVTAEGYTQAIVFNAAVAGTYAGWVYDAVAGKLCALNAVGYTDVTTRVELTYSGPIWVRLRRSGTNLLWDTSPDGSTWTNRRTETAPSWTNYHNLGLLFEAARDGGTNDYGEWDNLNTVPAAGPSTVSLTPAATTLTGVALTAVPGQVTVSLTPAAMTLAGVATTPVPQAVQVSLTPATMTLAGQVVTAVPGQVTKTLTPAALVLSGVALSAVPGQVTVGLTPAAVVLSGVALSPVPTAVTVSLTPAALTLVGVGLTAVPGLVTVGLTPAGLVLAATALTPRAAVNLTPATITFTPVPVIPPSAVNLTPATVTTSAVAVSPVPQPVVVSLTPASVTVTPQPLVATPGVVSVSVSPAGMTMVAVPTNPVPQAVTVALVPANVTFGAIPVTGVPGQVSVTLTPAMLTLTALVLGGGGAGVVSLSVASLSFAAIPVTGVPGLVTTSLTPASLALAAQPTTPVPQPIAVSLTPAGVGITAVPVTPVLLAVVVDLTPAGLTLTAEAVVAIGPVEVMLVAVTLAFSGVPLQPISMIARPASLSVVFARGSVQATLQRDTVYGVLSRPTVRAQI